MSKTTTTHKCPHCGNADPNTIEDNGLSPHSMDYTLLCVARVAPKDCALGIYAHHDDEDFDADRLVKCGCQWSPREATS